MVSLGGAWHSEEEDEETLLTNPKSRPDRHKTELGRGSCHREEESEEALATRLKIPAQLPPQPPGQLTQAGQAGFWPKRGAWSPGRPGSPQNQSKSELKKVYPLKKVNSRRAPKIE